MSPKIFRRHIPPCVHTSREQVKCECPLWVDWNDQGIRVVQSLKTSNWELGKAKAREMELRGIHASRATRFKYSASRDRERAEERNRLIRQQGERCAICSTAKPGPKGWCLDHDHVTGANRAVLCSFCNSILGFARDSEGILLDAILYLRKHRSKRPNFVTVCP
jgi:hypothetical protein